jgi:D-aminopeptidase
MRSLGRVYDAVLSRRTRVALGWPPLIVGFDDGRLNDQRQAIFSDDDVAGALDAATDAIVPEGAVGAATGLIAFGFKSGVGSASREVAVGASTYTVGALVLLNLGIPAGLRFNGDPPQRDLERIGGMPPLRGSAFATIVADAPLDDRQCRQIAATSLQGMGYVGVVPRLREGMIACAISTGVRLTRNDRTAAQIEIPYSSETIVADVAGAAAEAVGEACLRSLTAVAPADGTASYPVLPPDQAKRLRQPR